MSEAANSFNAFYAAQASSQTIRRIFRQAAGIDSLNKVFAPYSFLTMADMQRVKTLLDLSNSQTFADVACGNGSIGLWLAEQTGANLTGVDISSAAVAIAADKAAELGIADRAKFAVGNFENTSLATESVDAAVSFDAVWLATDQQVALKELARILRSGSRFVFTSWEQHIPMPFVNHPVKDYRPLLAEAGFEIESYEYLPHSEQLMMTIYKQLRDSYEVLISEMGAAIEGLIQEAHFVPGLIDGVNYISQENGPHVLIAARKT